MAHASALSNIFKDFADDLATERPGQLSALSRLVNGYEGWLRTEFILWLNVARGFTIDQGDGRGDVGVEYRARLDAVRGAPETKRCDMWLRAAPLPSLAYHYVEFKVMFANENRVKMTELAASDLQAMAQLHGSYEEAASGNLVLVANGLDAVGWASVCKEIAERVPRAVRTSGRDWNDLAGGPIRWSVWTVPYTYDLR